MKIEKGIPIPESISRKSNAKYPWPDMKVGDSFTVEWRNYSTKYSVLRAGDSWSKRNKDGEWKFTARKEGCNVRIWRVR